MARVRDAAVTLISLAILVPMLVLSAAVTGLDPRHWSGVPLSGVDFSLLGIHPRYGETRRPAIDHVTDQLVAIDHHGIVAVVPGPGARIHLEAVRLEPCLLPKLSDLDGAIVGVIYHPLQSPARLQTGAGASDTTENWWQWTDPAGTWATLMFGFPLPLLAALLLAAIVWASILRRRRISANFK